MSYTSIHDPVLQLYLIASKSSFYQLWILGPACETALIEKKVHLQKSRKKWPRTDVETATIVNFFDFSNLFPKIRLLDSWDFCLISFYERTMI